MRTQLRNRPARPIDPIADAPPHVPVFNVDEKIFSTHVRSARKGAAGRPSGITSDHLRPLLDSRKDTHLLFLNCWRGGASQIQCDRF